jgi:hypothetical protein
MPFAIGLSGAVGLARGDGRDTLVASAGALLFLPLVRRFSIGASPAQVALSCDTGSHACSPDVVAVLGGLLVPLGQRTWLGIEGPHWSWITRSIGESWVGLALGWSYERGPDRRTVDLAAVQAWNPPRPDEVQAFRSTRSSTSLFLATTAASRPDNQYVGAGFSWRRDRDVWNGRTGVAPGLELEIDGGRIDGTAPGCALAMAPTVDVYLLPNRLALTATPALLRYGAMAERTIALDIAARAGVRLDIARIELEVDSPPLSYVAQSRWHALPITVRLGLRLD